MTATSTDPRAARVAAMLTSVVLAAVLLTPAPVALVLLAWQTAVFAVGAGLGPTRTPYAVLFRVALRPRLGPPPTIETLQTEGAAPQRFAQAVGLAFAATGLVLTLAGAATAGLVAVGLALVAALLNAGFGLCLGCEMYLSVQRLRPRPHTP